MSIGNLKGNQFTFGFYCVPDKRVDTITIASKNGADEFEFVSNEEEDNTEEVMETEKMPGHPSHLVLLCVR